jgi:predicted nucleic acid-binding protein
MTTAAIDNDILFKGACYGMLEAMLQEVPGAPNRYAILGTAIYVVPSKIRRGRLSGSKERALDVLKGAIPNFSILEPTPEEQRFAAEIEAAAQHHNLPIDNGESQLCAIALSRAFDSVVTGDKRAIRGLATLKGVLPSIAYLTNRLVCLEQLILLLVAKGLGEEIRNAVCFERAIDTALAMCFSCLSPEVGKESWMEGLGNYIADLRNDAGGLLAN